MATTTPQTGLESRVSTKKISTPVSIEDTVENEIVFYFPNICRRRRCKSGRVQQRRLPRWAINQEGHSRLTSHDISLLIS